MRSRVYLVGSTKPVHEVGSPDDDASFIDWYVEPGVLRVFLGDGRMADYPAHRIDHVEHELPTFEGVVDNDQLAF